MKQMDHKNKKITIKKNKREQQHEQEEQTQQHNQDQQHVEQVTTYLVSN